MPDSHHGIPYPGPLPLPTPEHQRKITKEKWFEIATVIGFILLGTGFLAWQNVGTWNHAADPSRSMSESAKTIEAAGGVSDGNSMILNRRFYSYHKPVESFDCHIDLIGESPDSPLETVIAWLTPTPGQPAPSPESLQTAVNAVGVLGKDLLASSSLALEKASKTMTFVSDTRRPHDKGVAQTEDGWKLTYITYRSYDEHAEPQPMLCLILQRMSAGSSPDLGDFNRTLYSAVQQGVDIKTALRAAPKKS